MSEHHDRSDHRPADVPHRPGEVHTPDAVQYDRDLNVRGVVFSALVLAAGTLLVLLLAWWLFLGLGRLEKAADPPPPALREVRERRLPPEPRLQADADGDMLKLRAAEDQRIARPAWIDQSQGTVRIPVDLAIDVFLRRGLPASPANPASPATSGNPAMPATTPGALAVPAPPAPTPATTAPNTPNPPAGGAR
jgi:hypothetical protein